MIVRGTSPVVYSATDLTAASVCEWALMRKLDARLGRIAEPPNVEDEMLVRAGRLGDLHERRVLDDLRATKQVVEIERPAFDEVGPAAEQTLAALRSGADVVFQAAFFDGRFLGYADFIVREDGPAGHDGAAGAGGGAAGTGGGAAGGPVYEVYDTKLARKAKITALLQLAAYSDQLLENGIAIGENVHLWLGDNSRSTHRLSSILPVYRKRRARLQQIIDERVADPSATPWGDPRYTACGRCDTCAEQVQSHRDVLLVAGMRLTQRAKLRASGVDTIDALAAREERVEGMSDATLASLREQAAMQLAPTDAAMPVAWRVANAAALTALPEPSPGDIFFDFEGDPLHQQGDTWGLDYLFGLVEPDETFRAFWAHDLDGERRALIDFLAYVAERRAAHPGMHIYHYAAYERTHLLMLAARHGVGEEAVDDLLRNHVLVDLYPIVRQGLRIGSRSYSLKKLEPLYMGVQREGVANAADSITEYVRYTDLLAEGAQDAAASVLADIARYNAYDCVSTLKLRDWLLARLADVVEAASASGRGDAARLDVELPAAQFVAADSAAVELREPDPVALALAAAVAGVEPTKRTPDQTALALAAAAIDYHRREGKSFWWEHFARLLAPLDEWADTRGVFVVDDAEVVRPWSRDGNDKSESRVLHLRGTAAPGSRFGDAENPVVVYDVPFPPLPRTGLWGSPGSKVPHNKSSFSHLGDGVYRLVEKVAVGGETFDHLPLALAPATPPQTRALQAAIAEWGATVLEHLPALVPDAALDILRRTPPRLLPPATALARPGDGVGAADDGVAGVGAAGDAVTGVGAVATDDGVAGVGAVASDDGEVDAIVRSLLQLDRSYVAVQGPPGTGKTHTGSRVIAELVAKHGWKVGVVAQSHATVENMLGAVVAAGLEPGRVGKKPKKGAASAARSGTSGARGDATAGDATAGDATAGDATAGDATAGDATAGGDTAASNTAGSAAGAAAWTTLTDKTEGDFLTLGGGRVIGGTQWTFANPKVVHRAELDLLVIDEAGQFSLASTIAAGVSAERMLLLGDPQQLPQVSQGTHPEPVDESALAWLSAGHDVLPPEFGYFLETTWRMHPALCAPVSALSYEGRLRSTAPGRMLAGIDPGLHPVPVVHRGNSTSSIEEADEVVRRVAALVGTAWTTDDETRPLAESDLIVVAPYNAQVELVAARLRQAGFEGVAVGTVDTFQGQQAAVAIVSLAASGADDVPRGLEFLLLANRLNVAISRAQWAAYLVYSPALTEHLPTSIAGLAQLSAFITLVESGAAQGG